jgi:thiol-disulfide isomerase/thioredoxin
MRNLIKAGICLLTISVLFTFCKPKEQPAGLEEDTVEGTADLPSFLMINENREKINLRDFQGRKLFVNLWATWCPPCRAELPSIQKLYNSTSRDNSEFIMLSLDDNFQSALFYFSQEKFNFPLFQPAQNLPELFNVRGIPVTFIFDENGKLIYRKDGSDDYDKDKFREILEN